MLTDSSNTVVQVLNQLSSDDAITIRPHFVKWLHNVFLLLPHPADFWVGVSTMALIPSQQTPYARFSRSIKFMETLSENE